MLLRVTFSFKLRKLYKLVKFLVRYFMSLYTLYNKRLITVKDVCVCPIVSTPVLGTNL